MQPGPGVPGRSRQSCGAAPETERTSQNRQRWPKCDAVLVTLCVMGNTGKVRRVVRETVAVLVDELGREGAAFVLERAAAEVRREGFRSNPMTPQDEKPAADRKRTAANG